MFSAKIGHLHILGPDRLSRRLTGERVVGYSHNLAENASERCRRQRANQFLDSTGAALKPRLGVIFVTLPPEKEPRG